MNEKDLSELGFTKNESKVYASLAKFGIASANNLIKDIKLHKKVVYENLERLINKGLVTYYLEDNRRVFKLAPAHMLIELFDEKLAGMEQKKELAIRLAKELEKTARLIKHEQEASVYKGTKGIRTFYSELLKIGEDYIVFGAPQRSLKIMGDVFWRNFNKKRTDQRIRAKLLFNESIMDYGASIKDKGTEIRYLDKDFEPLTETNIQQNRVAIIVWTDEPILFLIQDKLVAESYAKYFQQIWKTARK